MRKLVLTDQAKIDLDRLDRATRLRVAAALQRLVLTNAGNIKSSRASIRRSTVSALATGASASPAPMPIPSASTAFRIARTLTVNQRPSANSKPQA